MKAKFINRTGVPQYLSIVAVGLSLLITIINLHKGISKNLPYPLLWRGIKGEVKTKAPVFSDALNFKLIPL